MYYPAGTIETSMLYTRARKARLPADITLRQTNEVDLPEMATLLNRQGRQKQFFPYWDVQRVRGDDYFTAWAWHFRACGQGELGLLGFWDRKPSSRPVYWVMPKAWG